MCDTLKPGRPSLEQEKLDIIGGIYVQKLCSFFKIVADESNYSYKIVHSVVSSKSI